MLKPSSPINLYNSHKPESLAASTLVSSNVNPTLCQSTQLQYSNLSYLPMTQSRMEYVPSITKYTYYKPIVITIRYPVQKTIIEYEQIKRFQIVPKQKIIQDYYILQHQIDYVPTTIQEKYIQYVPVQRINNTIQYVPREKQIIHYPEEYFTTSNIDNNESPRFGCQKIVTQSPTKMVHAPFSYNNNINNKNSGLFTTALTQKYSHNQQQMMNNQKNNPNFNENSKKELSSQKLIQQMNLLDLDSPSQNRQRGQINYNKSYLQ